MAADKNNKQDSGLLQRRLGHQIEFQSSKLAPGLYAITLFHHLAGQKGRRKAESHNTLLADVYSYNITSCL